MAKQKITMEQLMNFAKKVVSSKAVNFAKQVITHKLVTCALLILTMVWVYITYDLPSIGMECLMLSLTLFAAWVQREQRLVLVIPTLALCLWAMVMLIFSGKFGVADFNAPIHHALKFVYLLFVHIITLLMLRQSTKRRRVVLYTAGIVIVVGMVISIFCAVFLDPYAMRYFEEKGFTLVLDFNQLYAVPFIVTAVACYLMCKARNLDQLWAYLPFLLLALICVYLSLYTTALLLMLLGCGLAFLFSQYYRSPRRFWIIIAVIAGIVVICFLFRQQVAKLAYAVTEPLNWLVRARIRSVVDMILGTASDNWYAPDRRNELAGFSLTTFANHPIFGVGYAGYEYGVIGCHQEWYDMLGVFGITGTTVFLIVMAALSFQTYRCARTKVDKASFLICLTMLVIFGFLNPCLNLQVLTAVFVIAPNVSALPMPEWTKFSNWIKTKWRR